MTTAEFTAPAATPTADRWGKVVCLAAVPIAVGAFLATELTGDSGAEITAGLVDDSALLMGAAYVAVLGGAGLVLAAVRLGQRVSGRHGSLMTAAGVAVAVLFAAYYATFGAAGVEAQTLDRPGPGLGEAAILMLNIVEITRYAPGLALVAAAMAAGSRLPRAARYTAGALMVVPFTSWVAALLIPVWLGVTAAVARERR